MAVVGISSIRARCWVIETIYCTYTYIRLNSDLALSGWSLTLEGCNGGILGMPTGREQGPGYVSVSDLELGLMSRRGRYEDVVGKLPQARMPKIR